MLSSLPILGLAMLSTILPTTIALPSEQVEQVPMKKGQSAYDAWLMSKINDDPGAPFVVDTASQAEESYLPPGFQRAHKHRPHGRYHRQAAAEISNYNAAPAPTPVLGKRATSASGFVAPSLVTSTLLGAAVNNPSKYYFSGLKSESLPALPTSLLTVALDVAAPLATGYPAYNGSGAVVLTEDNIDTLELLATVPWLSRDAGRGGNLNGTKMFIFSDTETFTEPANETVTDVFTGFVSNSVATDMGNEAMNGNPPVIRDRVGLWTNNNGGMRGWIPWTTGEKEYNNYMAYHGGRIAIWPSSAITLLTATTAIQYASMVLVNTTSGASFHYIGTTMYEITVPNARSGPVATRTAPHLFPYTGMEWGSTGATRAWGSQGVGGSDGWVWAWANNGAGLWAARAPAQSVSDLSAYTYYWASTGEWNSTAPSGSSGSADVTVSGSYSASDIFYSPRHKTFINVYADRYIDNKLLWRYLMVDEPIEPTYDGSDFNLNIINYPWSNEKTLFQAPVPGNGDYVYAQGTQPGYFDDDDIINGGNLMLVSWTDPTGEGSNTWDTQYELITAVITWS